MEKNPSIIDVKIVHVNLQRRMLIVGEEFQSSTCLLTVPLTFTYHNRFHTKLVKFV